jgi:hypothetical protein
MRKWKDPDPYLGQMDLDLGGSKTCGSGSRSQVKTFNKFYNFLGEECVHTAGEVSALPLYKRPGLASGLSPNSPGRVLYNTVRQRGVTLIL